jgi:hypothetical protein
LKMPHRIETLIPQTGSVKRRRARSVFGAIVTVTAYDGRLATGRKQGT